MSGYTFKVVTQRLGGGELDRAIYHVFGETQQDAAQRLSAFIGGRLDEEIRCVRELTENEIEGLDLANLKVVPSG
ncbi:hypothetical protein [Roseobacter sp. CCS2]|uniref:hypothetical protein n=1 Tax=Roseobacter sp. CCS2 TaxID=391593 RepID=UPI0000F40141|nr:hypothetical protein [Roseobacter sp. CCS2]EBA13444.1 hypothetical protein RCCS2_06144 [Roseobacter sp. CCS2]